MKTFIFLEHFGVAGEPVSGYVRCVLSKPMILQSGYIQLEQNASVAPNTKFTNTHKQDHKEDITSLLIFSTINNTINMFPFNTGLIPKEYPPGIHHFPFYFILPNDFPVMFKMETGVLMNYSIRTVFILQNGTSCLGDFVDFPVVFNIQQPQIQPQTISANLNGVIVTLHATQTQYNRGDNILFYLNASVIKTNKMNKTLVIQFIAENNDRRVSQIKLNEVEFPLTSKEIINQQIVIPINATILSSSISPDVSLRHYVLVSVKGKSEVLEFPITILSSKPSAESLVEEYTKKLGVRINSDEIVQSYGGMLEPPPSYFSFLINSKGDLKDGIERVVTTTRQEMFCDHINRCLCDKEGNKIDGVYPFFESTTLPPGCTFGLHRNKYCIVDHVNRRIDWVKNDTIPQALLKGCGKAFVTIQVLEAEGLNVRNKKDVPSVYCCVTNNPWKKSKEIKGSCPAFDETVFIVSADPQRSNVILFVYDNSKIFGEELLGYVDIDLSRIPFPCSVEGWFEFHATPFGNEIFTGRIKLRIAYDSEPHSANDYYVVLPDVVSVFTKTYYPNTPAMQKQIQFSFAQSNVNGTIPYCQDLGNGVIGNKFEGLYESL